MINEKDTCKPKENSSKVVKLNNNMAMSNSNNNVLQQEELNGITGIMDVTDVDKDNSTPLTTTDALIIITNVINIEENDNQTREIKNSDAHQDENGTNSGGDCILLSNIEKYLKTDVLIHDNSCDNEVESFQSCKIIDEDRYNFKPPDRVQLDMSALKIEHFQDISTNNSDGPGVITVCSSNEVGDDESLCSHPVQAARGGIDELSNLSDASSLIFNVWNEDFEGNRDPKMMDKLINADVLPTGIDPIALIDIKRERLLLELKDCDLSSQGSCEVMMGHMCGGFDDSDSDIDDIQAVVKRGEVDVIADPCKKNYNTMNDDRVIDLDDLKFKNPKLSTYVLVPDGQYKPGAEQQELVLMLPRSCDVKSGRRDPNNSFLQHVLDMNTRNDIDESGNNENVEFSLRKYDSTPQRIAELVLAGKTCGNKDYDTNHDDTKKSEKEIENSEKETEMSERETEQVCSIELGEQFIPPKTRILRTDDDSIIGDRSIATVTSFYSFNSVIRYDGPHNYEISEGLNRIKKDFRVVGNEDSQQSRQDHNEEMKDGDCDSIKESYKQKERNEIQNVKIVDISITSDTTIILNARTEINCTKEDLQEKIGNSSFDIKLSGESISTVSNTESEIKLNPSSKDSTTFRSSDEDAKSENDFNISNEPINVASKDNDNTVVDKVVEGNANIGEVLSISNEALRIEVKEEADIINDEEVTNVDVEEHLRTTAQDKIQITLQETAKVKELEMISVDTIEVDNINGKIVVENIDELTNTIVENEGSIVTEEAISIENKEEIRTNVEGASDINIKSIAAKIVDEKDYIAVVEIEKVSKISVEENFEADSNQTTDKLSCLPDSITITQLQYITVNTDESDVNLDDKIKDIETANINFKEVATASEESDNTEVEDEDMIDVNDDVTECETNKDTMIGLMTVASKDNDNTVLDKVIEGNANIGEVLSISKEANASEESDNTKVEDEDMIDLNNITECETNEDTMIGLMTVASKDNDNTVVDKVVEGNANIGEVLSISNEALRIEVKEEADIINDEEVTNVDVEEHLRTTAQDKIQITLQETAKVKELEMISVDTIEVDNINGKIEVENMYQSEILGISNEALGTEVKEEADIIDDEEVTKVDVEEDSLTFSNTKHIMNKVKYIDNFNASLLGGIPISNVRKMKIEPNLYESLILKEDRTSINNNRNQNSCRAVARQMKTVFVKDEEGNSMEVERDIAVPLNRKIIENETKSIKLLKSKNKKELSVLDDISSVRCNESVALSFGKQKRRTKRRQIAPPKKVSTLEKLALLKSEMTERKQDLIDSSKTNIDLSFRKNLAARVSLDSESVIASRVGLSSESVLCALKSTQKKIKSLKT